MEAAVRNNHIKIARRLLDAGANINACQGYKSALGLAVKGNNAEMARELLRARADVNSLTGVLAVSLFHELDATARRLLHARADLDAEADLHVMGGFGRIGGGTPLCAACAANREDWVRILLQTRADANKGTYRRPLDVAIEVENANIVHMLLDAGADRHHVSRPYYLSPADAADRLGNLEIRNLLS